jgi:phosphatidylglycerophosphate synthase
MKLSVANLLSLSRIPTGAALVWTAGLDATDGTTARRLLGLFLVGIATDELDGTLARRSGVTTPKIDSVCDMLLQVGLLIGGSRLRPAGARTVLALAIPPGYILSQVWKRRASPDTIRRMNQVFFVGSIGIVAAQVVQLARIAGLSRLQVAAALTAGLGALAASNRDRVIRALDGRP